MVGGDTAGSAGGQGGAGSGDESVDSSGLFVLGGSNLL